MKRNLILGVVLFAIIATYTSCDSNEDDGTRGFMSNATIVGNATNGYHCYLDGGGLVISQSQNRENIERGYFSFNYMQNDWKSTNGEMHINNARVHASLIYDVITPISREEAEAKQIFDKNNCQVPSLLSVGYGYRGYLDLHGGFTTVNLVNLEESRGELNIIYDSEKQSPDTLRLQLCYNANIPEDWSKIHIEHGNVSCDISSLANLEQWSDSVTIVVEVEDDKKHFAKISKRDFLKPNVKVE